MAAYCPGNPGELLVFKRPIGYSHYAVNVGDGYIVHLTSRDDVDIIDGARASSGSCCCSLGNTAVVKKEPYSSFAKPGDNVIVEDGYWNGKPALPTHEIVARALSRVGEPGYNLLFNNCEHFARWCRYDEDKSDQAINMGIGLVGAGAVGLGAYLLGDSEAEEKKKAKEQSQ